MSDKKKKFDKIVCEVRRGGKAVKGKEKLEITKEEAKAAAAVFAGAVKVVAVVIAAAVLPWAMGAVCYALVSYLRYAGNVVVLFGSWANF